ncbi:MAG TPA: diacylglycerol kinase family protein [Methylomirabilota bacterium]|jgi:diacylglycerol kinase (ATP)|nr:diacylglycerol kinase family protein [Methylomirabilota bacterium]
MERFFAIVNPAAGGGRSAKLAGPALERLRKGGLEVDEVTTGAPGDAVRLARDAYARGYRRFLAVGGDGTGHEILNGIFAGATAVPPVRERRATAQRASAETAPADRVAMGFLPLGTGNSFLRDYTREGAKASLLALLERRTRTIDLMRLTHSAGEIYSFNLVSVGFTANVGALTNRHFKPFGHLGYLLGVFVRLAQLRPLTFAVRCDDDREWDQRPCLFLTFNNSAYTGGTMWIAPSADASDGLIEYVHWGPIGRFAALRMLPTIYDGKHMQHPQASRRAVRHVEFNMPSAVDVMVDGEVLALQCRTLDIVPAAVDVYI